MICQPKVLIILNNLIFYSLLWTDFAKEWGMGQKKVKRQKLFNFAFCILTFELICP
jgi:hypothetical protein